MKTTRRTIYFVTFLSALSAVHGCGQLPTERTINFILTGVKLPAPMVYSTDSAASSQVPTISTSEEGAKLFVRNLIIQSVEDVLYRQGRSAGLSDDVISLILQQLTVDINYNPLQCIKVFTTPTALAAAVTAMMTNCQIISGTLTNICTPANPAANCDAAALKSVPPEFLSIPGSLKTSNIIMANWSMDTWRTVLNRVLRGLSSGAFASNFSGSSITIN